MQYDKNLVKFARRFAITDQSDLKVGRVYYSNCYPYKFCVIGKLTNAQAGADWKANVNDIGWIDIVFDHQGELRTGRRSLNDWNVGASYNPWLIFEDEEAAKAYKELTDSRVTYSAFF